MIATRVSAFLRLHGLGTSGRPLLAGVSGGPDSLCLLHALHALELPAPLVVVHVDHQLRAGESQADAAYVEARCRTLGVPAIVRAVDVRGHRRQHRLTLEEAARDLRLRVFADLSADLGAEAVLVGHTLDDQAETVLLHVLRGSGIAGLGGMEPVTRLETGGGAVVLGRPLLVTSRAETEAYCKQNGLEPRRDASNVSLAYTRNRVRHELLPVMRTFNPAVTEALTRLASSARNAAAFLDLEVQKVWAGVVTAEGRGLAIDRAALRAVPPALATHLLRRAVLEVSGSLDGISAGHLGQLQHLAAGSTGKRVRLPGGVMCVVEYGRLNLTPVRVGDSSDRPSPLRRRGYRGDVAQGFGTRLPTATLNVPGVTLVGDWEVSATLMLKDEVGPAQGPMVALMNGGLASTPLWVSTRQRGDRFQPLGMPGSKKLQDLFVDVKVPLAERDAVPIVRGEEGILWVVGYRLAEVARIRPEARSVLRLEFRRRVA